MNQFQMQFLENWDNLESSDANLKLNELPNDFDLTKAQFYNTTSLEEIKLAVTEEYECEYRTKPILLVFFVYCVLSSI